MANSFAPIADFCFSNTNDLTVLAAWIGLICYTLQIYFDFSGYSDMAIGLGKMFGFEFHENFDYPYISKSITEFWRRWHISLGSWFRDYVYIPLGGSRVNKPRLIFNLFVVWSLTGIWHGANWTFLLWGIWYFVLLTIEKLSGILKVEKNHMQNLLCHGYTLFAVMIGWVLFRADSISHAILYLKRMFIFEFVLVDDLSVYLLNDIWFLIIIGVFLSTPLVKHLWIKCLYAQKNCNVCDTVYFDIVAMIGYMLVFFLCIGCAVNSSYNPFIYFNF